MCYVVILHLVKIVIFLVGAKLKNNTIAALLYTQ